MDVFADMVAAIFQAARVARATSVRRHRLVLGPGCDPKDRRPRGVPGAHDHGLAVGVGGCRGARHRISTGAGGHVRSAGRVDRRRYAAAIGLKAFFVGNKNNEAFCDCTARLRLCPSVHSRQRSAGTQRQCVVKGRRADIVQPHAITMSKTDLGDPTISAPTFRHRFGKRIREPVAIDPGRAQDNRFAKSVWGKFMQMTAAAFRR